MNPSRLNHISLNLEVMQHIFSCVLVFPNFILLNSLHWLLLTFHSQTKYVCGVYLSHISTDYSKKNFCYRTSKVEYIPSLSPFSEIYILRDFSVHRRLWRLRCSTLPSLLH